MRALAYCGFEYPSEGNAIIQSNKNASLRLLWALTSLLKLSPEWARPLYLYSLSCNRWRKNQVAYQIDKEFVRFCKYFPQIKHEVIYGGKPIKKHKDLLKKDPPHIIVGTPGRISALVDDRDLDLSKLRFFILDECDKMLSQTGFQLT